MARPVASTPHLVWAAGHALTLIAGLRYLLGVLTLKGDQLSHWYTMAYFGAVVSYGVVVYKSFGVPQVNKAYVQRALMDENVQYLFLAFYWAWTKPIFVTVVPYTTFSLFHVLTFVRTTIIPMAFPNSTPPRSSAAGDAAAAPLSAPAKASKFIQTWVKANYDPAMRFVAYSEVAIFIRVLLGGVLMRNSLIAPLVYAHFCRLRFYMSSFTRDAFQYVGGEVEKLTLHQACPPAVRKVYLMGIDLMSRYASTVLNVNGQGAPAQGAPAAAAVGAAQQPAGAGAGAAPRR